MRIPITSSIVSFVIFFIVLKPASSSYAQGITNPDSVSKNSFGWNQEERQFGFSHFDQIYKARDVPRGNKVHVLPQGMSIPAFCKGGQKETALEAFMTEQKVAGLLILQDGKIRMERYALGFSEADRWTSQSVAK